MDFPKYLSFTLTNACNLRCRMCGQWSETGYVKNGIKDSGAKMKLSDWKRLVDEAVLYSPKQVLIRGGEPFLYPGIIELLEYIHEKGIGLSVDSNGSFFKKYAADVVRIGNMHITFSVDGPEDVHDEVRGVKGSFSDIKESLEVLAGLEKNNQNKISRSICFTISKFNYKSLGQMPDVARSLGISSINIVPYYYFTEETGRKYAMELMENFGCVPFSWKGFNHNESGVDFEIFKREHDKYLASLDGIENFPYMPLKQEDFKIWFTDSDTPVIPDPCRNIDMLLDIQPDGEANFCVDFPDYSLGNVQVMSLKQVWDSDRANKFREYRKQKPLAICYRCGAKYISELP